MRALQLSLNAAPLIPNVANLQFHEIAGKEYDMGLLSCTIRSFLPDETSVETVHMNIKQPSLSIDSLFSALQEDADRPKVQKTRLCHSTKSEGNEIH